MAAIPTWGASNTSTVTNNSNFSWVDVVTYTFPASSQEAGASYVVFWNAAAFGGSTSVDYLIRVTEGGVARAAVNVENKEATTPPDRDQQAGFFVFTAAGAPADTTFAIQLQTESTSTSSAYNGYLRIVKLPAGSAWSEQTGTQTLTGSSTFTDVTDSGISVSGDHILFASVEAGTQSFSFAVDVAINVDGIVSNSLTTGVSDTSNSSAHMVIARANVSGTAKLQFRQTTSSAGNAEVRNRRLLAIPASAFRNVHTAILGAESSGTNTTYTTALTNTQTVSAGNHLLIGAIGLHPGSTTASSYARLTSGGAQVDEFIREGGSATSPLAIPSGAIIRLENYSAGPRTWTIDRKSESTNTTRILAGSAIAVIDLDDAASGAPSVTPASGTHAHAATSPSLAAKNSAAPDNAAHAHSATSPSVSIPSGTASTLDYRDVAVDPGNLSTYSFPGLNFGAAASGRYVIAAIAWRSAGTTNDISSVTIGGVTATSLERARNTGGGNLSACDLFIAAVPTGTTGEVVVNTTETAVRLGVAVYRLEGVSSPTPQHTGVGQTGTTTNNASITPAADSHVVGIAFNGNGSCVLSSAHGDVAPGLLEVETTNGATSTTWSALTEDSDLFIEDVNGTYGALIIAAWDRQAGGAIDPADVSHTHSAGSPALTARSTVSAVDASHAQTATTPTVGAKSSLAPANASHAHSASSPTLAAASAVSVQGATHSHTSTQPALAFDPADALPDNGTHGHTASEPDIVAKAAVAPNGGAHAIASTSPALGSKATASPADAAHGVTSTSPSIGGTVAADPDSATHPHAATSPTVSPKSITEPADGAHGQIATSPILSVGIVSIAPAPASHDHTSTSPILAAASSVAVNDNEHGHSASSPSLGAITALAVPAPASHAHTATEPVLTAKSVVAPASATHGLSSATPSLTSKSAVAPSPSAHSHAATSSTLAARFSITPASSVLAHAASTATFRIAMPLSTARAASSAVASRAATSPALPRTATSAPGKRDIKAAVKSRSITSVRIAR